MGATNHSPVPMDRSCVTQNDSACKHMVGNANDDRIESL